MLVSYSIINPWNFVELLERGTVLFLLASVTPGG